MTTRNECVAILLTAMLLPGLAAAADAPESADSWLEQMNHALHELNYEGRFVYQHGQNLEAMYLAHTVNDGQEHERLLSLTGVPREVIRDNNTVTCIVSRPDEPQIDRRPSERRLSPVQPIRPDQLSRYYRFDLGAKARVAGRDARTVTIMPRDNLRYGYLLLLDSQHALPLATATIGADGHRISQLLFTDLRVGQEVVDTGPSSLATQDDVTSTVRLRHAAQQTQPPHWRFQDMPAGFVQTRHITRLMGNDDHEVEHFIFTDGLATVSVYVEQEDDSDAPQPQAVSRLGAMTALSRHLPGYRATAVGEVPQLTLQRFLDGIQADPAAP